MVKEGGAILGAEGFLGWVVAGPEDLEQLFVGDLLGVEVDLEGFAVIAHAAVAWVFLASAGVADTGADDAFETPKLGVRAPESAEGEGRDFERNGARGDCVLGAGLGGHSGVRGFVGAWGCFDGVL